jgi:large subunit ribosomal protein L4
MAKHKVITLEKKAAGSVELDPAVFAVPVREHLLHAESRRQLAARRSGSHSTKNRHEVAGGGAKPWRQKGTGRARQGSIRSPQWAGGGVVFGPVPRSYAHALPKKVRRAALCSALSAQVKAEALTVVDHLEVEPVKTRRAAEILRDLGLANGKVLIVIDGPDAAVERATRNLPRVRTLRAEGLNVYDVLWAQHLLLTKAAVTRIAERLTPAQEGEA